MRGHNLLQVLCGEIAVRGLNKSGHITGCERLLQPDHYRIKSSPKEHKRCDNQIHNPDSFGIYRGKPFIPEPFPPFYFCHENDNRKTGYPKKPCSTDREPLMRKRCCC